eukprot:gnl/MRDRNA2_/MRDRNA2_148072_c0_seq1.p1 gnl/MRDRNA2_/MRDRNA2_148072_c0~~gnl/MRDRNA2_/MRDRNA2_148072_c0_seq1.p1  ORF type:complete len:190 (-),score=29.06 gnl/MRDRNA2_/MRDRNA2_148072_c0_seq1:182-667(-)
MAALFLGRLVGAKFGWGVPDSLQPRLAALRQRPFATMLAIRLAPLPLGVKNYGLAMCDVDTMSFFFAALVVNAPFSVLWNGIGAQCTSLADALNYESSGGGAGSSINKILIAVLLLAGAGVAFKYRESIKALVQGRATSKRCAVDQSEIEHGEVFNRDKQE